jgi:RNA polymerase sigma-70 factor (ECF subfamily)
LPVEKRLLSLGKANILISELEQTGSSDESPSPAGTSDSSLLRKFQDGQPDASTELYLRYAERLHALVAAQSSKVLARRVDAEEIVQSVFRTFFRRAAQGHYSVPAGEEIWKLLLVIALNKVRANCAAKRDMRQTVGGAVFENAMESEQCRDEGALTVLRMVIEDLLEGMTAANRRTIELRIEGYEVAEITERVQRSKRTVERVLQGFRNRLEALIQEDLPE